MTLHSDLLEIPPKDPCVKNEEMAKEYTCAVLKFRIHLKGFVDESKQPRLKT